MDPGWLTAKVAPAKAKFDPEGQALDLELHAKSPLAVDDSLSPTNGTSDHPLLLELLRDSGHDIGAASVVSRPDLTARQNGHPIREVLFLPDPVTGMWRRYVYRTRRRRHRRNGYSLENRNLLLIDFVHMLGNLLDEGMRHVRRRQEIAAHGYNANLFPMPGVHLPVFLEKNVLSYFISLGRYAEWDEFYTMIYDDTDNPNPEMAGVIPGQEGGTLIGVFSMEQDNSTHTVVPNLDLSQVGPLPEQPSAVGPPPTQATQMGQPSPTAINPNWSGGYVGSNPFARVANRRGFEDRQEIYRRHDEL
ncbi:MAG: hypothetical protein M1832_002325 [Thelocarpon impressellum]|nr:MAG: hypothetical protein M1832_002325 [Thelocarpon impressellum]